MSPPDVSSNPSRVLSETEAATFLGISIYTIRRLQDPPRRVQLSTRRFGYQVKELERWLASRTVGDAA